MPDLIRHQYRQTGGERRFEAWRIREAEPAPSDGGQVNNDRAPLAQRRRANGRPVPTGDVPDGPLAGRRTGVSFAARDMISGWWRNRR
jgi:hypothetical protein